MSSLSDLVRSRVSGWSFTSWDSDRSSRLCLTVLPVYQITWSILCLVGTVAEQPVSWLWPPASLSAALNWPHLMVLIGYIASQLGAALLLLLWRRAAGIRMSLILQWGTVLIVVWYGVPWEKLSGLEKIVNLLLDSSMNLALAMTAFLLTSSQLRLAYDAPHQPSLSRAAGQADGFAPVARRHRWRREVWLWFLILLALLLCLHGVLRLQHDGVDFLQATRSLTLSATLSHHLITLLHIGCWLSTVIVLIFYRRWASIQFTLLCLWVWALYDSGETVLHCASYLQTVLSTIGVDQPRVLRIVIRQTNGYLLDFIWPPVAIAWTGYLLSSPYVRARYPGGRRRGMAEVGADVF
jgi:hypothetical protein